MDKPDYKNWMPKGMIWSFAAGTAVSLAVMLIVDICWLKTALAALTVILAGITAWTVLMYRAFSYTGTRQMSRRIIEGVAEYIRLPKGGRCLDVGCGSGALAIHDIFSRQKYGDMQAFVERLKDMGYEQVELIPTDGGHFMSKWESQWMGLKGSAILVGKK